MEIEPTVIPNINFSDGVIREQGTGKLTLIGTFQHFNVQQFPFQPAPFFVTVALANLRGKLQGFKIAIRLQDKSSGHVVASTSGEIGSAAELKSTDIIQVPFQITGIFHSPGIYSLVVLAQSEEIGSCDLLVKPVTGVSSTPSS
jgi:hypothetical protein